MLIRYYALFSNAESQTKGFRFMGTAEVGKAKPPLQPGDILIISEEQLHMVQDMLQEQTDADDYYLFEIEGDDLRTSGACQVVYLGKHTSRQQLTQTADRAKRYKSHWLMEMYNYREINEIFQKLEPRCGKLH